MLSVIYLSPTDLATLHAEFARAVYANLSDAQRFAYISTPEGTVANPAPQGQVPVTMTAANLMSQLNDPTNNSAAKVGQWPNLASFLVDVKTQNHAGIPIWAKVLAANGSITPTEMNQVIAFASSTVTDPSWSSTVPGPTPTARLFGGKVWTGSDGSTVNYPTLADVAAAR